MNLTVEQTEQFAEVMTTFKCAIADSGFTPDAAATAKIASSTVDGITLLGKDDAALPDIRGSERDLHDLGTLLSAVPASRWLFETRTQAVDAIYIMRGYLSWTLNNETGVTGYEAELMPAA